MTGVEIAADILKSQPEPTPEVSVEAANAPISGPTNQENLGTSLEGTALMEEQSAQDKTPEVLLMKPQASFFLRRPL